MEKANILRGFLEKGLQLDFESLEFFYNNPNKIDVFFEKISTESKPTTVTMDFINKTIKEENENLGFRILKTPKQLKNILNVDDISRVLNARYIFLQKILKSRIDLVNLISINRITPKAKRFSAIIIIKEKIDDEKAILGEDDTGEYKFFFMHGQDYEQLLPDDVVGVVCENAETAKVEKIIWPDLSMKREINKTREDLFVVISNHQEDAQDNDHDASKQKILLEKGHIKIGPNLLDFPSTIEVSGGIIILLMDSCFLRKYSNFEKDEPAFIVSLLRRRNLDPTFQFNQAIFSNDPFIIEHAPDIFVVFGSAEASSSNYKGTTILTIPHSDTEKTSWIINLKTREVIKK